jgi:sugar lactone lactonase YvrE
MTPARFFPEGVTVDRAGNFYMGSMDLGAIYKGTADSTTAVPFIPEGSNGLVSVLGLYADDPTNTLWVCSSDAGNGARTGMAPVAIKAFNLTTGAATASYAWPAPTTPLPNTTVNGFCNDLTVDADGNVYATDSWYPRIVRLKKGATALDVWVENAVLGAGQWHLNGIDVDQSSGNLFVFDQGTDAQSGKLFRISIAPGTGNPGTPTQITMPAALRHPDGLKVIAPNLIAMGEAAGAVSLIKVTNNTAVVTNVIAGLRGVATLALHQGSAWAVEGQGDHFWDAANAGPNANPPFRLMEIPLSVGAGLGNISIGTAASRFFPEGVTSDDSGNFFVGSMDLGSIYRVAAGTTTPTPFVVPDATNDLVSVLGLYADNARNRLWVCSSDAGNAQRSGSAPVALKSFNLTTGAYVNSWAWPAPPTALTPIAGATVNGFCNDITIDGSGNVYATDSWYPRVLRLANGGAGGAQLTNWLVNTTTLPQDQWHLNGIDVDPTGTYLYVVENHPGHLYRVTIGTAATAGALIEITTQRPLYGPDGLKALNPTTLLTAEGSGMSVIDLTGTTGRVQTISTGFDGIATFTLWGGNAWLVENQGDHFWNPGGPNGPTATKPFRLVETPLSP